MTNNKTLKHLEQLAKEGVLDIPDTNHIYVNVNIINSADPNKNRLMKALVDTGADTSIIPIKLARELGVESKQLSNPAKTADGRMIQLPKTTGITFEVGGYQVPSFANIGGDEVILGCHELIHLNLVLQPTLRLAYMKIY